MALSTTINVGLSATLSSALDLVTASAPLTYSKRYTLPTGTSSGQADKVWSDTRTIAASGNEDLDLAGSLTDALGTSLTFAKLKAVLVEAAAGNTNNVQITRPADTGVPLFMAAGDGIAVLPGGLFVWIAPGAGVAVTASTGDIINVANSSSGSSVTYSVVIIGTSA